MTPPPLPPPMPLKAVKSPRNSTRSCLFIFLGALIFILLGTSWLVVKGFKNLAKFAEAASRRNPHIIAAPKYVPLLGQNLVGAGFHVEIDGRRYICATLHQFDGSKPEVMGSLDFDGDIVLKEVVHKQVDLQLISYESKKLDELPPLRFSADPKIEIGLPVYLYPMDGEPVKGHVISNSYDRNTVSIHTSAPFQAAGMSGSPVVSGESGTVIGILTDANDPDHATEVGAELLNPAVK